MIEFFIKNKQGDMNEIIALYFSLFILLSSYPVDTAVLDPALYLYPSPPVMRSDDGGDQEQWARPTTPADLLVTTESKETTTMQALRDDQESMQSAETFWPKVRSVDYALQQIHVPMAFSLTGNYGGYRGSSGVIGNAYASLGGTSLSNYGKSALAGSGYGNYGSPVRIFGGNHEPSWTGWGNGRWGHYGKG